MKTTLKRILALVIASICIFALASCAAGTKEKVKIAVPDDATNLARAIKLLEKAGFIEVDPAAGYSPELKDITKYIYNIELVPQAANTLPATLTDYQASIINGTYAIPAGLVPSKDGLIIETSDASADNPYVNIIVSRTADKDSEVYKKIVAAYQTQEVAEYMLTVYKEAYYPVFDYNKDFTAPSTLESDIETYWNSRVAPTTDTVVTVGVCGANNNQWHVVQKILDEQNAGITIKLQIFDAYTLPNEALNAGDIDLNAFQHVAFLNNEISKNGYDLTVIGTTLIAPLTLYSKNVTSLDQLKNLAGKAQ